ncbi:RNA helicase [Malassezia nana]|uniref:RNA helicase n=1 Tax=Malassezia nana TaxID=180528 RepID=A0AAF0EH79_9BASI|nr:RNA helicase [Malassezia nana]
MAKELDFLASDDEDLAPLRRPEPSRAQDQTQEEDDDAAFIAAAAQKHNVKAGRQVAKQASKGKAKTPMASGIVSGGGSFQSMGLHPSLLRALLLRGFTKPTPIQRRAIPAILAQPPQDVVGMARTGSGKTLSYIVPLIQRLHGRHSTTFGIKSVILCPSRELALQILKVGKDLARGWHGDDEAQREAIRWALIVGGESLDEQFAMMTANPDVVIATPGRLLHLVVEMNLDLKAVEYVVFDEADRLFEMGFADQLEELLRRLPSTRQTLLFSATLPKTLIEFARAGLGANPKLIRLDADSKISPDLRMAFFSVKPSEKDAALLQLIRHVIQVPTGELAVDEAHDTKKRKRMNPVDQLQSYQTIIFCATKHHVEYLLLLLTTMGYACSHIYSSLDQAARSIEMNKFRAGRTSLLIVTDLAARGIDLPVLEHVINYDFPPQARIFVHRVGRTARAGRRGWAWSLCTHAELPYLCDLQLFLGRPLVSSHTLSTAAAQDLHANLVLGTFPRDALDLESESIRHALHESSTTRTAYEGLLQVVERAHRMYVRSQPKASAESHRRAKDMLKAAERSALSGATQGWALAGHPLESAGVHDVLQRPDVYQLGGGDDSKRQRTHDDPLAGARAALLAKVNAFRPGETVLEMGARGPPAPLARLMQDRRRTLASKQQRARAIEMAKRGATDEGEEVADEAPLPRAEAVEEADESEIASVFDTTSSFRDPSVYLSYEQSGAAEERGYSFAEQAKHVTVDMAGDEVGPGAPNQRPNQRRWDTKKKKFIQGDGTGSDNQKLIRSETGLKLPASYRSGRFDAWRKEQQVEMPHVGEDESSMAASTRRVAARVRQGGAPWHRGFHHTQTKAPKPLDKLRYDYHAKRKAQERRGAAAPQASKVRNELQSASQIQRAREIKERRRAKNARPSKKRSKK